MSSTDALLQEAVQTLLKLYDPECMMAISESVAHGYLVLLGGAESQTLESSGTANGTNTNTNATPKDENTLAFMALAHGNVLDACFGVHVTVGRREETPASRAAQEAKQIMEECGGGGSGGGGGARSFDSFKVVAVQAYTQAFRAVIEYRRQYDRLNCITRCFRAKKLRVSCEKRMQDSFLNLAKAVVEQKRY